MHGSLPYRAHLPASYPLAPALGWTRPAAFVIAGLGALVPAYAVYELLADHECHGEATPHVVPAVIVPMLVGALVWGALALQRRMARWVSRTVRTRSRLAGGAWAATTLVPVVVLSLAGTVLAAVIDFTYTFHICMDFGDSPPLLFGWNGC